MKIPTFFISILACLTLAGAQAQSQEVLDNQTIIKLVQAGLSQDVIVELIKTRPGRYSTGPDDLVALKAAGVPDPVISALLQRNRASDEVQTGSPQSRSSEGSPSELPLQLGVYYKRGADWIALQDEKYNVRSGGALMKSVNPFATVSSYMTFKGAHSMTGLRAPTEFLIVAPRGIHRVSLVSLERRKDRREVRFAKGRMNFTTGFDDKNLVPFNHKEVASGRYLVQVNLAPGEYAFAIEDSQMYTFRVLE